ncbi:MAG: FecR domain-containing protein [Acetobacter sp.]|uniref:FecR family protein n=1 Tax=Acetobacter sp. TaxID=440 RepID=UPI0039E9A7F5
MTERKTPAQVAAGWYLYLREDPDDEDLKIRFKEWLASDPAHVQAWADMNVTASVMAEIPLSVNTSAPIIPASLPRVRAHVLARRFLPGCGLVLMAACAAMIFLTPDTLVRLRADHYAPVAQTREVRLADGSEITLAPKAAISITMNASERSIHLLQGEALFNVHHDPERLFRVTTSDAVITDIGTTFDVRTDGAATVVAVREGSVRVIAHRSAIADRDLRSGEWERVSGAESTSGIVPVATIGTWRNGTLVARNETVGDLIQVIRSWTSTRIILTDRKLSEKRVTGTYDLHQPEASLRQIVDAYGGHVSSWTSWVDIVTAR